MDSVDVIIVGAGAAGLMCAAIAAKRGLSVLVIEHTSKPGKKILMSGGGKCNFTNLYIEASNYLCSNPHFVKSALKQYTQWDFIALLSSYQIAYHERDHGQLFCDHSAKDILSMLLAECEKYSVTIKTKCQIEQVLYQSKYQLDTNIGQFNSSSLILATGGLSIPTMKTTDYGHQIARQFGMNVLPLTAGLVPFVFTDRFKQVSETLSGIAVNVELSNDNASFREALLFTHRGLSGPVALQLSNYWKPGEMIHINLFPDTDMVKFLSQQKELQATKTLSIILHKQLPKKLIQQIEMIFWPDWKTVKIAEIPDTILEQIGHSLNQWSVKPSGTEGYRTAEVTLGGVDTQFLSSKTMESTTQKGLYFIGEVVDVTGHLGGYNFQWAWSSAYVAGMNC